MNKVAIVTAEEMWTEFNKLKKELKKEIVFELKENDERKLYTRKQLANHFQVSQQTIINWSSRDILKPIYIQGRVFLKTEQVAGGSKQLKFFIMIFCFSKIRSRFSLKFYLNLSFLSCNQKLKKQ